MFTALTKLNNRISEGLKQLDFLPLLALRLYLAPIFLTAGFNKLSGFSGTVQWFDETLGLPMPFIMAVLATGAEIIGGFALLFGLGTRIMSIPLMVTMLVAAFAVHWQNGWFAIAPGNAETSMANILNKVGFPGSSESLENSNAVAEKLEAARSILQEYGNYDWLTEAGNFTILNNGIEFAITYFIMLLVLFIYGAGRYASVDYWISKFFNNKL